jgi:hypothetical protein
LAVFRALAESDMVHGLVLLHCMSPLLAQSGHEPLKLAASQNVVVDGDFDRARAHRVTCGRPGLSCLGDPSRRPSASLRELIIPPGSALSGSKG